MMHTDLRKKFIQFFTDTPRNHKEIPSAPLVPENDPTTLFTSSGMQPLIPYLLGEKHPLGTRLVNSQKSFRSQDIEEVGDNRHTTFFEMLGNWSLGDYFKQEQIPWFYEFLTKTLKLPKEKIAVSVFEGNKEVPKDEESAKIWKSLGIPENRIYAYGVEKNWWSRSGIPDKMPSGEPGGPDSEVFFEFTDIPHNPEFGSRCHPNCNCGRFLEIGNSVFMQYKKQPNGSLKELSQKNVDFGGGLERLIAATLNEPDIFNIDLFSNIIQTICRVSGRDYSGTDKTLMRIIADHLKAATFIVASGISPSNKTQGYVLRRLIRRAAIKLHQLEGKADENAAIEICTSVLETYNNTGYFDPQKDKERVTAEIGTEMSKFTKTIRNGMKEIDKILKIDGKIAFNLYQTYGFPLEITAELFAQKGQKLDYNQFKEEFNKHQNLSRTASKGMFKGGLQDQSITTTKLHTATHLLQQALRGVLGDHVRQKGSHITAERLRFDFTHPNKLTPEQINQVQTLINEQISKNQKISMEIMDLPDAIKQGALTVPGANYPEKVKVYSIGNFSKEVCGGPHVDFTGSLGLFKIIKEEASGSNVRRIYAVLT